MACRVAKKKEKRRFRGSCSEPLGCDAQRGAGKREKKNTENDVGAERLVAAEDWTAVGNCD